eukprot:3388756-Ditylum_brightwellii.AAC.1
MVADWVAVNGSKVHPILYDMHDGKIHGAGVAKPKHSCSKVSDREAAKQWGKSKEVFEQKLDQAKKNKTAYTSKMHMNWADMCKYGISHFGMHPTLLLPSNICFDVFHLRSAMTRKLLGCLQK